MKNFCAHSSANTTATVAKMASARPRAFTGMRTVSEGRWGDDVLSAGECASAELAGVLCGSEVMFAAALNINSTHSVWSRTPRMSAMPPITMAVQSVIRKRVFMISSSGVYAHKLGNLGNWEQTTNDMAVRVAINQRACEFIEIGT